MNPYERIHRIALIAAIMLAIMFILALRSHAQDGDIYASCSLMPRGTPEKMKARHDCFAVVQARETAKRKALEATTTYTIILYTPNGEQLKFQAHSITSNMTGVEFLDMSNQHRMRINGTYTLESSTDQIIETETDAEEED